MSWLVAKARGESGLLENRLTVGWVVGPERIVDSGMPAMRLTMEKEVCSSMLGKTALEEPVQVDQDGHCSGE